MDRMSDSGSDDGSSSLLVVTNKRKTRKKKRKRAFNFLFSGFSFSKRSFGRSAQRSEAQSSRDDLILYGTALEEVRSAAKHNLLVTI